MEAETLLSKAETAQLLGISVASIKNWQRHGLLQPAETGQYLKTEVDALIEDIKSGKINRLNRRANKKHTKGSILPNDELKSICESILGIELPVSDIMFLLAVKLFTETGALKPQRKLALNAADFQSKTVYKYLSIHGSSFNLRRLQKAYEQIMLLELPTAKPSDYDIAGRIYQAISRRGDRSVSGSFYTPPKTADALVNSALTQLSVAAETTRMIDPCCGTGQFLLSFIKAGGRPENAFGIDSDGTAAFIAGVNLLLQCPEATTLPKIITADSLKSKHHCFQSEQLPVFDMVVTNPPWGACTAGKQAELSQRFPLIKSGESFSHFICRSFELVRGGGIVSAVLPESITNVKRHEDIRSFIRKNAAITDITGHGRIFKGVYTPVVTIEMRKTEGIDACPPEEQSEEYLKETPDFTFNININSTDAQIIDKLYALPHTTLKNRSEWALGIVTGDNSRYIRTELELPPSGSSLQDYELIIRGSDIQAGLINQPASYIRFTPDKYQQAAPEWKYRVTEKLVYRFISKRLVFAVDRSGMLTLNSANILIPDSEKLLSPDGFAYTATDVMNLFNSDLYNFVFRKRFNSVKVLRSHLEELPIVAAKEFEAGLEKSLFSRHELKIISAYSN